MKRLESWGWVAVGCVLVLATNAALLAAAARNRRGEPRAELSLTERELGLPPGRQDERSGILLSLRLTDQPPDTVRRTAFWRREVLPAVDYAWCDRAKLRELGFDVDVDPDADEAQAYYDTMLPRRTYLVLEYDGAGWKRWIGEREAHVGQLRRNVADGTEESARLADAQALLALDRTMRSRLFPVDAGRDPDALRERYPDRRRYAVVAGAVRPTIDRSGTTPVLRAEMHPIVWHVQVPTGLRPPLEPFLPQETFEEIEARERREASRGWPTPVAPHYRATLTFGRRREPWLAEVTALERPADAPTADIPAAGANRSPGR